MGLREFAIVGASGEPNLMHHGRERCRAGEKWISKANPLVYRWCQQIHAWILFLLESQIASMPTMGRMQDAANRGIAAGLVPFDVACTIAPKVGPRAAPADKGRSLLEYLLGPAAPKATTFVAVKEELDDDDDEEWDEERGPLAEARWSRRHRNAVGDMEVPERGRHEAMRR